MPITRRLKSVGRTISFRFGLSTAVAKLQSCTRIIMYHGIRRCDQHLLAVQLHYFKRHFRVVSLDHIVKNLALGNCPDQNEMVLTFDDGLRNNATVAYPILKHLRMPATFFVCPGLINAGQWLWTHEARCRLKMLGQGLLASLAADLSCAPASIETIVERMKTLNPNDRLAVETRIREATRDFRPNADEREAYDQMDWHDLSALDPEIITIGSHTLTHPILPTLEEERINFEIAESRRQLEARLNREVAYFCYPNGSHHGQSVLATKQTYAAAVTTENGVVSGKNCTDLHHLPRIPATRNGALMAWRLHRPGA